MGPVAYGVRATTSRDVLRRRASRENLRLETVAETRDSVVDELQHPSVNPDERESISSVDVLRDVDRDIIETDTMAEEWRRMFYTARGQDVNPDIMNTVLAGALESGFGDFSVGFEEME